MLEAIVIKLKDKFDNVIYLNVCQVEAIVNEWYTNGMEPDIFQNESGCDLEEKLERGEYWLELDKLEVTTIKYK